MPRTDGPLPAEAVRDLLGIVRGMYAAAKGDQLNRKTLRAIGTDLVEALRLARDHEPNTDEHRRAWVLAEGAIRSMSRPLHWNAPLAPVLGYTYGRIRRP